MVADFYVAEVSRAFHRMALILGCQEEAKSCLLFFVSKLVDIVPKARLVAQPGICLLYTSPSPRDATLSRMPSSA